MEMVNPSQPPKIVAFLGWKGLTISTSKNIVAYKGKN
jgi:hypothetical protein